MSLTFRVPGGPITGPNVLKRLTLKDSGSDTEAFALFDRVLATEPEYLPGVSNGTVTLPEWYRRKGPQWRRVAYTPAAGHTPVGHVAVRLNGMRPDGPLLAPRLAWELSMLVVAPGFRGCGIATRLIVEATTSFKNPLWASVHTNNPGHHLLTKLGWTEVDHFYWPNDPHAGLIMRAPDNAPHT